MMESLYIAKSKIRQDLLALFFTNPSADWGPQIGVRSILLALSFLVKKAEKDRVFTLCLLLKEFFV